MKLYLANHAERYALEQLQMSLFPSEPMEYCEAPFSGDGAVSTLLREGEFLIARAKIILGARNAGGECRLRAADETVPLRRRILQQSYYLAAMQLLDEAPPWGALAGVRPTKLTSRVLLDGGSEADCDALLRDVYFVDASRRRLCIDASRATVRAAAHLAPADISLYIGIPFCPTRCAYCSFVSASIEKQAHLLEPFLQALLHEIEQTGKLLRDTPLRIRSVYFGGGTPTAMSTAQISMLMDAISCHFDLSNVLEYTVEGGRPDTLDFEKLSAIHDRGANRMSINPQTMRDDVLTRMGRKHSTAATLAAYENALRAGFEGINMDLIAGLPGDDAQGFSASLAQCIALAPTNLTVHTLSLKRGSDLNRERQGLLTTSAVKSMLDSAETALRAAEYTPYYLYKQKYMSGSFENIGWCKEGFAGLYNIYMMEELQSILSLGGGGMSKLVRPDGRIERFNNPKYPKEYIDKLEDTLQTRRVFLQALQELDVSI